MVDSYKFARPIILKTQFRIPYPDNVPKAMLTKETNKSKTSTSTKEA